MGATSDRVSLRNSGPNQVSLRTRSAVTAMATAMAARCGQADTKLRAPRRCSCRRCLGGPGLLQACFSVLLHQVVGPFRANLLHDASAYMARSTCLLCRLRWPHIHVRRVLWSLHVRSADVVYIGSLPLRLLRVRSCLRRSGGPEP